MKYIDFSWIAKRSAIQIHKSSAYRYKITEAMSVGKKKIEIEYKMENKQKKKPQGFVKPSIPT